MKLNLKISTTLNIETKEKDCPLLNTIAFQNTVVIMTMQLPIWNLSINSTSISP